MYEEIWTECYLFPKYEVSSLGRVRNKINNRLLKVAFTNCGYPTVKLYGVKYVAVLVYRSFDPFFDPFKVIGYRDGNKKNVSYENLYQRSKSELCKEKFQKMSDEQKKNFCMNGVRARLKSYSEKYTKEQFREIMRTMVTERRWPSWATKRKFANARERSLRITEGRRNAIYAGI